MWGLAKLMDTEINNNFHSLGRVMENLAGFVSLYGTGELSKEPEVPSAYCVICSVLLCSQQKNPYPASF